MSGLADRLGITAVLGLIGIVFANIGAFFTALITDIIAGEVVWVILDVLVAPVGVVRGWLMWFGVI